MRKAIRVDALIVSAAGHSFGLPELAVTDVRPRMSQVRLVLVGLVLSTAALGFALFPAINEKPPTVQSCQPALLSNGTVGCATGEAPGNVENAYRSTP